MKPFAHVLAILATLGVWVADAFLLSVPAFRNGWWTLTFFALFESAGVGRACRPGRSRLFS